MKFVNNTKKDSKIKILDNKEKLGFHWITAKVGAEVDIPKDVGERELFTPVKGKGLVNAVTDKLKGNKKKKGTPKNNVDKALSAYKERLIAIDGVGTRIVEDVIKGYPTEEALVNAITNKEHLPFRDDVSEKLCNAFGYPVPADEEGPDEDKKR